MSENPHTIENLLAKRGAVFNGKGGDAGKARRRASLTHLIEHDYCGFEAVRNELLKPVNQRDIDIRSTTFGNTLAKTLVSMELATISDGHVEVVESEVKRYLTGGWLEELAWLAATEAGADEAVFGQRVSWEFQGYTGENEIDLIVRKGGRLGFASCKALKSSYEPDDSKHRTRLMDALHEADNLCDHFGGPDERVAVLVTTDLIDEIRGQPRYIALMGKAAILDVRIIPLEELGWSKLVRAIGELLEPSRRAEPVGAG